MFCEAGCYVFLPGKEGLSFKKELQKLSVVYFNDSASDEDITAALSELSQAQPFLTDSELYRGYSGFLGNILKYERVSIFISRVETDNYPTVRAFVNVNGTRSGVDKLADDFMLEDFTFNDNGLEISTDDARPVDDEDVSMISISLVIDGSGGMNSSGISNDIAVVKACIKKLDPDHQELSVVMYDNGGLKLLPLRTTATS